MMKFASKNEVENQRGATCNDCLFLKDVLNEILTFEVRTVSKKEKTGNPKTLQTRCTQMGAKMKLTGPKKVSKIDPKVSSGACPF